MTFFVSVGEIVKFDDQEIFKNNSYFELVKMYLMKMVNFIRFFFQTVFFNKIFGNTEPYPSCIIRVFCF